MSRARILLALLVLCLGAGCARVGEISSPGNRTTAHLMTLDNLTGPAIGLVEVIMRDSNGNEVEVQRHLLSAPSIGPAIATAVVGSVIPAAIQSWALVDTARRGCGGGRCGQGVSIVNVNEALARSDSFAGAQAAGSAGVSIQPRHRRPSRLRMAWRHLRPRRFRA